MKFYYFAVACLTFLAVIAVAITLSARETRCTFAVAPRQLGFDASGGSAQITVTASSPDCPFTVKNGYRWIAVSPVEGKGSGTIKVSVAPNASRLPHMGSVSVDGTEVLIIIYAPKISGDG